MHLIIAAISGSSLVNCIIWIIAAGLIFWLLNWALNQIALPEPFAKIARVIIVIATVLILINAILGLTGHPLIAWP